MRVMFVHQNFPAQFGHIARHLVAKHGDECIFVSHKAGKDEPGLRRIKYRIPGKPPDNAHFAARLFETTVWHSQGVYDTLKKHADLRPDLIVGHSGFGSTLYLREIYDCPILNYFEYFYRPHESDSDYRPDFPAGDLNPLRTPVRNALLLLDLENCDRGYSPTRWQQARMPAAYRDKVAVAFDGIDPDLWKPLDPADPAPGKVGNWEVPADCKLVTYATRGMESMRGFDVFLGFAHRLSKRRPDVHFAIAGQDRICYGGDKKFTGDKSFKEYLFSLGHIDASRFHFLGLLPPPDLAKLFAITDLHVYLTIPFVLSWGLFNALSCEAVVLASDTPPVREIVFPGETGLLCPFFDEVGFVEQAERVLDDPAAFKPLGRAGRELMRRLYSYDVCLPRLVELYRSTAAAGTSARVRLPWFNPPADAI